MIISFLIVGNAQHFIATFSEFPFMRRGETEIAEKPASRRTIESENAKNSRNAPYKSLQDATAVEPNALIKCEKVAVQVIAQSGDFESENNRFSCQLSNSEREKRSFGTKEKRFGNASFYISRRRQMRDVDGEAKIANVAASTINYNQFDK